jgi:hypothetical protein
MREVVNVTIRMKYFMVIAEPLHVIEHVCSTASIQLLMSGPNKIVCLLQVTQQNTNIRHHFMSSSILTSEPVTQEN